LPTGTASIHLAAGFVKVSSVWDRGLIAAERDNVAGKTAAAALARRKSRRVIVTESFFS
jgi:hypothetical protein